MLKQGTRLHSIRHPNSPSITTARYQDQGVGKLSAESTTLLLTCDFFEHAAQWFIVIGTVNT